MGLPYYLISFYDKGNYAGKYAHSHIRLLFCMICFVLSLVLWLLFILAKVYQ